MNPPTPKRLQQGFVTSTPKSSLSSSRLPQPPSLDMSECHKDSEDSTIADPDVVAEIDTNVQLILTPPDIEDKNDPEPTQLRSKLAITIQ